MIDELRTQRLLLRPLARSDLDALVALNSDDAVMQYLTGRPSTPEEVADELDGSLGKRWLVFEDGQRFLGWVGATPTVAGDEFDIGWRFRSECWGRGFASEAASGLVDALFSGGARRGFAPTMAVNRRSRAVMERLGMRYARTFHLDFDDPLPGTELGEVEYELTAEQHRAMRW